MKIAKINQEKLTNNFILAFRWPLERWTGRWKRRWNGCGGRLEAGGNDRRALETVKLERISVETVESGAERRRGNRVVQLDPRFPPEMWSVYQRTLDGASRTNNYAEAANRRIQTELGVCHPTLGNFILSLKKAWPRSTVYAVDFRAPTKRQAQEVQRCRQANFENSAGISKK
ncbi:hypothetical protein DdX_01348 [Ditylenchus destructor]|uniref:Uncharacterized protein n=1 Tax=Ditylenchus destructor TaxID=166010 RepID=A0AAD4NGS4_9BILA|nr:hypothetical protein DdX_01348 [Ditylenchus destructor]